METKVIIGISPNTREWSKAMKACNNANNMKSLITKKIAREELKKLMAKLNKGDN